MKIEKIVSKWMDNNAPSIYAEGLSWYEALIILSTKINDVIDQINLYFDEDLEDVVTNILNEWIDDGTIQVIISEALQTQIDDVDRKIDDELGKIKTNIANINSFPRLASENTDDGRIRRALDSLPDGKGLVFLDGETYHTTLPVLLSGYQGLIGVYGSTVIEKTGNETSVDHEYDSVVAIKRDGTNSVYGVSIIGITIKGLSHNDYGLHLGLSTHLDISNVTINNVKIGVYGDSAWLAKYNNVIVRNYYQDGDIGFHLIEGTSNVFERTWVKRFNGGYNLGKLHYSSLLSAACDTFKEYAYTGGQAISYNGCGAEDGQLISGGYVFGGGARSYSINGCQALNIGTTAPAGESSLFHFIGSRATINNFRATNFNQDGLINVVNTKGDAYVEFSNSTRPTNFHEFANIDNDYSVVVYRSGSRVLHYFRDESKNYDNLMTSNTNGEVFKFDNGLMMCTKQIGGSPTSLGMDENNNLVYEWTFPESFPDRPHVDAKLFASRSNSSAVYYYSTETVTSHTLSKDKVTIRFKYQGSNPEGGNPPNWVNITLMAYGRYK